MALYNSLDCHPPGSSVHGIIQARNLERVAISFFAASSQPRDQTHVSCIHRQFFTTSTTWESWFSIYLIEKVYIILIFGNMALYYPP